MSTTEYSDVFEERRQALTTKLPSEIELCKRSNTDMEENTLRLVILPAFTIWNEKYEFSKRD